MVVHPANADEQVRTDERPQQYLERVVLDKWSSIAQVVPALNRFAAVLVADTIVVVDDDILGKPSDLEDAERLLRRIVGREHVVYTRFAIGTSHSAPKVIAERTVATRVFIRATSESEVARYAATGEGLDKAGAYAAQGIGAFLIERVDGSYTNVVGLPLCEVVSELRQLQLLVDFP